MAAFTQRQLEYLRSQRLAHLATADAKGAPHVVPLRFRVATDGAAIEFGGRGFGYTKKYRAMKANRSQAAARDADQGDCGAPATRRRTRG
jgi:pyridoxamine 5'-phosphate oxidase family protein